LLSYNDDDDDDKVSNNDELAGGQSRQLKNLSLALLSGFSTDLQAVVVFCHRLTYKRRTTLAPFTGPLSTFIVDD
jgi:hypothetical protein